MPEHPIGLARAQGVGVVDALAAGDQRRDDGHGLVADIGPAGGSAEVDMVIEQIAQAEVLGQSGGQQEAGTGNRVVIVELH